MSCAGCCRRPWGETESDVGKEIAISRSSEQDEPVASGCSALITLTCDRFRIQVDAAGLRHRHSHSATRIALVKKHSAIFSSKPSELQGSFHRQTDSASTSWIHSPAGVFPCFGTNARAAWARCTRLGATGDSGSPPLCMQSLVGSEWNGSDAGVAWPAPALGGAAWRGNQDGP